MALDLRIIVNISSVVGRFGFPGSSAYVSTKFAIEGLSESMAYELEPFGIKMVLVEHGFIKTNIGDNMVTTKKFQDANSPILHIPSLCNTWFHILNMRPALLLQSQFFALPSRS